MKNLKILILAIVAMVSYQSLDALDLKSIMDKGSGSDSKTSDLINTVSSIVGGKKAEYSSLVGTWKYTSPAVSFKSDNFLQKAGGAAASSAIEAKIKPYYQKAGLTSLVIEFKQDSSFVAKTGKLTIQGTVNDQGNGSYIFNLKAFGKIPGGKINGFIEKNGSNISVTFDASKLIGIASAIASASGNSTLKSASALLKSYDGLNAGFKMQQTK